MEFAFNCDKLFASDQNGLAVLDSRARRLASNQNIKDVLDKLGRASSKVTSLL